MVSKSDLLNMVDADGEPYNAHLPVTDNGKTFCGTVKDDNNPYSVWSVSPPKLQDAIDRAPADLYLLAENQIAPMVGFDARLRTLRVSFQREYERVITHFQRTGQLQTMKLNNIFGGIVSDATFYRMLQKPECVVYMTMPLVDYFDSLKALSTTMLERYDEIIRSPVVDKDGKLMVGAARVVLEAMNAVEDRIFGKALQRMSGEIKSVNVTVPVPPRSLGKTTDILLTLERRVKELSAELYGMRKEGDVGQLNSTSDNTSQRSPDGRILHRENVLPGWSERRPDTECEVIDAASSDCTGCAEETEGDSDS